VTRLEAFVREHGAPACELLIQYSGMHLELDSIVASSRAYERAIAEITQLAGENNGDAKSLRPAAAPSQGRRKNFPRHWRRWSLAATILLAVGGLIWLKSLPNPPSPVSRAQIAVLQRPPQPVACVTSVADAKWGDGVNYNVGRTLNQRQRLELVAGTAQISMASGADIVLQAPCKVVLAADDLVILERGKLTAQAAKWATGFVVQTNGLRVTDLGTRFAVSADSSGIAEAHVLEGEVLAEPMKRQRPKQFSMLLKSGQAIRVSVSKATIDLIAAQSAGFVDKLQLFRPFRPIQLWNTGVGMEIGKEDQHWSVTAGDAANGPYPRPATITAGDRSYLDNMPDASQWISVHDNILPGVTPKTVHTFETKFDLTGYDLDTVHIVGLFLVDDAINQLRINGHSVPFKRWQTTWDKWDFKSFHPIVIKKGFVPGENVISVDVYNSPSEPVHPMHPNPMGLRVEWQAFGSEAL